MSDVFFYGTLCDAELLSVVLGRNVGMEPASLPGYAVHWADGESFPLAVAAADSQADGVLVRGLCPRDLDRLAFYEGGYAFAPAMVAVAGPDRSHAAQVFLPEPGRWTPGAAWDLADWQARFGLTVRIAAQEVMGYYGRFTAQEVTRRYPIILSRAQAKAVIRTRPMPERPGAKTRYDVVSLAMSRSYAKYYTVEDHRLQFTKFDGTLSEPVERAALMTSDAVTVLPYDPVRDRVLVIDQFRMGPYMRDAAQPWMLEPAAGRVDAGETFEDCAFRETLEETGVALTSLELVGRYYPSPGCLSEVLISYVGLADLPDDITGVSGLEDEHEDIKSELIAADRFFAMAEEGLLQNGPLLMTAYWLRLHRDRLRAGL